MTYQNLSQNLNSVESKIFINFFTYFVYRLAQSPHKHQNIANQIPPKPAKIAKPCPKAH
ncbi:hypothetical protein [Helicobacter sp. MIT 01-3238]|uniref:hypothetical protein n=1 Tax=Helicobacter sp. MIT 01-3238 TaxID=398627 RepID=UPI0015F1AE4B|nr:hypothetical protein [Helicobacter sp. MIT 01-3238]